MDRHYYADHALTIARHPSETEERLMVRLLAFALHASPDLSFGRGISSEDEADLWQHDPTGLIDTWISVGLPEPKWLRKASARSRRVIAIAFGNRAGSWWTRSEPDLARFANLTVLALPPAETAALALLAERAMKIDVSVQDGTVWVNGRDRSVELTWQILKAETGPRHGSHGTG